MAFDRLRTWRYGPISQSDAIETSLGCGSVTVETVLEAVHEIQEALNGWSRPSFSSSYDEPVVWLGAQQAREVRLSDLNKEGETALNEMNISFRNPETSLVVNLTISSHGSMIGGDPVQEGAAEAFAKARDSVVSVFEREMDRRVPKYRRLQIAGITSTAGLFAVWLWAMFSMMPPAPVWAFSLMLTAAPMWILLAETSRRAHELRSWKGGWVVTVDSTPREDLRAQRFNRKENVKQRLWAALIAAPAGAILGAVVTALLRD